MMEVDRSFEQDGGGNRQCGGAEGERLRNHHWRDPFAMTKVEIAATAMLSTNAAAAEVLRYPY